jgi:hypothetical protein
LGVLDDGYSGYLSVLDDGYSGYFERTWWRLFWLFWAYLLMVIRVILIVLDDGYSGYFERTWWWLFWLFWVRMSCMAM